MLSQPPAKPEQNRSRSASSLWTKGGLQLATQTLNLLGLDWRGQLAGLARGPRARLIADRMNAVLTPEARAEKPARAGEVMALGLLTDIARHVVFTYVLEFRPTTLADTTAAVESAVSPEGTARVLSTLTAHFPPDTVRAEEETAVAFLARNDGALRTRDAALVEALVLNANIINPAAKPYRPLLDDTPLRVETAWPQFLDTAEGFLATLPPHPETGLSLPDTLRAPARACPDSLEGQLGYVVERWQGLLPPELLEQLTLARGILREELAHRGGGPGPAKVLEFSDRNDDGYEETEQFTVDRDWMPNVVLLAKTVYVWLDQLSKKYGRTICHLDQVPDEELDMLAQWGYNALWLIGLWERSPASREIKRRTGNPEAEASAYSLFDYTIAGDLGGHAAYENLSGRARARGIRLASDMVPNHMGIDSSWVREHPDWFVQLSEPPYPGYTFTGPDVSHDARYEIVIEDGYWERRDAAVVFKRHDRWNGDTRYIYHGNDGTSMPWNDTAQLNFLLPELREAVIQTILHVARMFPIIRFDAAMTLAKKHFQRLWYPKSGDEGAIPSRAEHGMSRAEFDAVFPAEFWREVVDRVAEEVPDTLLLAEAFWLMEGYFVRTLGMHRVYNSAFMNMLKTEENAKYRQTIKNVMEFSPEILQRFVNFMNNPDEDTAEAQFGKGDKYFGVAALLSTLPGLPMFGHGQVEGYTEKYGMEYRRAYRDEAVDEDLVRRHEREIFPILRRRYLFSGSANFALFDLVTPDGWVNEDVYAYVNGTDTQRALIVFHNKYADAQGVLFKSTAINTGSADEPHFAHRTLTESLNLHVADNRYYVFRDARSGLEYLAHSRDLAEKGLHLHLHAYEYRAYLDWRAIDDHDLSWGKLHASLAGRGVPDMDEAHLELVFAPLLDPFRAAFTANSLALLADPEADKKALAAFWKSWTDFLDKAAAFLGTTADSTAMCREAQRDIAALQELLVGEYSNSAYPAVETRLAEIVSDTATTPATTAWCLLRGLGALILPDDEASEKTRAEAGGRCFREWLLRNPVAEAFNAAGQERHAAFLEAQLAGACVAHGVDLVALQAVPWGPHIHAIFDDAGVQQYLHTHTYGGKRYIVKEQLDALLDQLYLTQVVAMRDTKATVAAERLMLALDDVQTLRDAAADVSYDLDQLIAVLK